jgi:hypothetical protein
VGFVFVIQFFVPITLILINLVISMNLFRYQHIESYQRRSPKQNNFGVNLAPVRYTACAIKEVVYNGDTKTI